MIESFRSSDAFENLVNESLEAVLEEVELFFNKYPEKVTCDCDECILDVICIALNKTPSRYRTSLMGRIFDRSDESFLGKIREAVAFAMDKVAKNPSH